MGSLLSRHLRDLGDIGGFEASYDSLPAVSTSQIHTESCPVTPNNHPSRMLEFDPRSPTAEIVRTPIEVASNISWRKSQDSPKPSALQSRRSYLETDLDTLSTQEFSSKPESINELGTPKNGSSLPPGLTCAHLMKLRFLGMDPRSPSSDVVRTPLQFPKDVQRDVSSYYFDDTLSVGSISSQDFLNNSICSSDFTRDCSDPSAFISENEESSEKEEEHDVSVQQVSQDKLTKNVVKEDDANDSLTAIKENGNTNSDGTIKTSNKLIVFREYQIKAVQAEDKDVSVTPEGLKKVSVKRPRTPLTPIGNRNRTPNSILRAKQSQTIEKEILTKAKIYSTEENVLTPSRTRAFHNSEKENSSVSVRPMHKGVAGKDENASLLVQKKHILAQWDQDTSVVI